MLLVSPREDETEEMDEATHLLRRQRRSEPSTLRFMIQLTVSMLGLQIVWSVETSFVSPYMLSLGMSKNLLAIVLIAGPLSGAVVQPYIGVLSDRYGMRKPFIIGGALATIASLLGLPGANTAWAIALLIILDCAINTMQAGIRAFIVDNAPTNQQERANAWASRMSGIGNILGYFLSSIDWSHRSGRVFTSNQFLNMSWVASGTLLATLTLSFMDIEEHRRPGSSAESSDTSLQFLSQLRTALRHLPRQVRLVCYAQFFAWIGWFPILFYTTTYVGEIYALPIIEAHPHMTEDEIEQVWQKGTVWGNRALMMFAITSFAASVVLPLLVASPETNIMEMFRNPPTVNGDSVRVDSVNGGENGEINTTSNLDDESQPAGLMTPPHSPDAAASRASSRTRDMLTLNETWVASHAIFTVLTVFCTFLVRNEIHAIILIGLIGIPWAMTLWAPFALIAAEISRLNDKAKQNISNEVDGEENSVEEVVPQAGTVLGIHNVAIAAPQVISTIICSVVFRLLEKRRGTVGDESVAWVIRICGMSAIVAAFVAGRVRDDRKSL